MHSVGLSGPQNVLQTFPGAPSSLRRQLTVWPREAPRHFCGPFWGQYRPIVWVAGLAGPGKVLWKFLINLSSQQCHNPPQRMRWALGGLGTAVLACHSLLHSSMIASVLKRLLSHPMYVFPTVVFIVSASSLATKNLAYEAHLISWNWKFRNSVDPPQYSKNRKWYTTKHKQR